MSGDNGEGRRFSEIHAVTLAFGPWHRRPRYMYLILAEYNFQFHTLISHATSWQVPSSFFYCVDSDLQGLPKSSGDLVCRSLSFLMHVILFYREYLSPAACRLSPA